MDCYRQQTGFARTGIRELISGVDYLWVLHSGHWGEEAGHVSVSGFTRRIELGKCSGATLNLSEITSTMFRRPLAGYGSGRKSTA